jgi:curved DNA-binding protein CbpA
LKDHYRTLGVPDNASEQDIKLAYRRLAKRYHPDVNAGAKGAEERFKEITEAYNILSDFSLRRAYDAKRMRPVYFYSSEPKEEKKDPRRKEYSEEDLERARMRHKKKTMANVARRKKILVGMIVTFIAFMVSSAVFDNWIEEKRKRESEELAIHLDSLVKRNLQYTKTHIQNMDSPFDSLFGTGVYQSGSKNKLVIYMPFSDAVICAVQSEAPYRTIRNEFIQARNGFVMPQMPDGKYFIKFYTGKSWDINKKIPGGKKLGGFTKDEMFFKLHRDPYNLKSTIVSNDIPVRDYNEVDTVMLNPYLIKFDTITREEFFNVGE